jgi:glycerophosphoryl diester phosphodiesterase
MGSSVLTSAGNSIRPSKYVYIAAHRGAPRIATENTRAAFEAAIRPGVDFIESDVRRTADGILVLHHDADAFGELIAASTFSNLLQLSRGMNSDLTTLEELLTLAKGRIRLDIELKEAGYEKEIVAQLQRAGIMGDDFVITTFRDDSLSAFKTLYPMARCGLLVEDNRNSSPSDGDQVLMERLKKANADFVAAEACLVSPDFARRFSDEGYPVWVWTVDEPEEVARFLRFPGVQAVITNRPDLAVEARSRLNANSG